MTKPVTFAPARNRPQATDEAWYTLTLGWLVGISVVGLGAFAITQALDLFGAIHDPMPLFVIQGSGEKAYVVVWLSSLASVAGAWAYATTHSSSPDWKLTGGMALAAPLGLFSSMSLALAPFWTMESLADKLPILIAGCLAFTALIAAGTGLLSQHLPTGFLTPSGLGMALLALGLALSTDPAKPAVYPMAIGLWSAGPIAFGLIAAILCTQPWKGLRQAGTLAVGTLITVGTVGLLVWTGTIVLLATS
jgi:hypothetical protein